MRESEKFWSPLQNFHDKKLRKSAVDFEKIVQGFGAFPNKFWRNAARRNFAKSTMCVHTCIACQVCFTSGNNATWVPPCPACHR